MIAAVEKTSYTADKKSNKVEIANVVRQIAQQTSHAILYFDDEDDIDCRQIGTNAAKIISSIPADCDIVKDSHDKRKRALIKIRDLVTKAMLEYDTDFLEEIGSV